MFREITKQNDSGANENGKHVASSETPIPYHGAAAFENIDFFPTDHKNEFISTTYGSQIKLIDEGELLHQFKPRVQEILKKLRQTETDDKMLTFCITVFDCEIKIIFLSDKRLLKETIDNYEKQSDSKRLLIIKYLEDITVFLFDKKKEIAQEQIYHDGLTQKIYTAISKFEGDHQEIELKNKEAMELFSLMEGLLFGGDNISPVCYRVAVSGFGDKKETDRLSKILDKLAHPIPYASKQDSHAFPSASVAIKSEDASPDEDKLIVFERFLKAATSKIEKDISSIEIKYRISLDEYQKNALKNIKNLFCHMSFKSLLSQFNAEFQRSMEQNEFLIKFMFKYQHFDYTSYFARTLGATLCVIPGSAMPKDGWLSKNEREAYKTDFSLKSCFPTYYESLNKLATECHVTFESLKILYQLFSPIGGIAMAARSAHCAEDALLLYMKEHPEKFTAQNSSTYIFSVQIEKNQRYEDIINIHSRCEVCKIHFDHDICHILNIPEKQVSRDFSISSNTGVSSFLSAEERRLLSSTGVFAKFTTSLPGVVQALSEDHRHESPHAISASGEDEYSKLMNAVLQTAIFQKKHKSDLLQAAARGRLAEVTSQLERAKKNGKNLSKLLKQANDDGNTAMHYAAMTNIHKNPQEMCQIILILLDAGADPTIRNKSDKNVLSVFMEYFDEKYQDKIFFETKDILETQCLDSKIAENDFNHLKFVLNAIMPEFGNQSAFIHRERSNIILNETLQKRKRGERRAKDFSYAVKTNKILPINISISKLKHISTISDGNCALNAIALGLLFHKGNGIDLFTDNQEFRETFSEVFTIPKELLTAERFSCVIDAIISYDINLSNPIIISILKKLQNITEISEGSESNQLNNRIMVLRDHVIDRCAYEEGSNQIKKEDRESALFCLAYYGELFQLVMSMALRKLCVKHYDQIIDVADGQGGVTQETLKTTNKFGEYVGTIEIAFLAQYFNVKILEKQGEFVQELLHNPTAIHEISLFCLHPGRRDCHYELGLSANKVTQLLGGRLVMDDMNAPFSSFFAVNLQKAFLKPEGPQLYCDQPRQR